MTYLSKTYYDFLRSNLLHDTIAYPQPILNEVTTVDKIKWVAEKVECLRKKMAQLRKQLSGENDPELRRKLQMEIKVCELKIMIARIK